MNFKYKNTDGLKVNNSKRYTDADAPDDADPSPQDVLLWRQYTHTHGLQKSCGEKGLHGRSPSSREGP